MGVKFGLRTIEIKKEQPFILACLNLVTCKQIKITILIIISDNEYWGYPATFFSKVIQVAFITSNQSYVLIDGNSGYGC